MTRKRVLRGAMWIAIGVLGVVGCLLGPSWLGIVQGQVPDHLRRRAATIYLDGLLAAYALAMVASVSLIGMVVVARVRSRVRHAGSTSQAGALAGDRSNHPGQPHGPGPRRVGLESMVGPQSPAPDSRRSTRRKRGGPPGTVVRRPGAGAAEPVLVDRGRQGRWHLCVAYPRPGRVQREGRAVQSLALHRARSSPGNWNPSCGAVPSAWTSGRREEPTWPRCTIGWPA